MSAELLEQKRRWLKRLLFGKYVSFHCHYEKLPQSLREYIKDDFMESHVEQWGWGWGGDVIDVYFEKRNADDLEIWVLTDEGMAHGVWDTGEFSWLAGQWGPAGKTNLEDREWLE